MQARPRRRIGYLLALIAAAGLYAANRQLFLLLNGLNSPLIDPLFLSVTHLGNGAVAGMLVLLVFPFRRDISVKAAIAALVAGTLASIFKEVFASPRPPAVFGDGIHILGKRLTGHSLPSGHTATAFGIAFALRGLVARRVYLAAVAAACLVGYSRIYIGAHFPMDVVLGGLAGWAGARATASFSDRLLARMGEETPLLERSLLVLALVSGLWIALAEPMLPHNPVVLRGIGFGGAAAAAVLLGRARG